MIIDREKKVVEFLEDLTSDLPVQRYYWEDNTYILSGNHNGKVGDLVVSEGDTFIIYSLIGENLCELKDVSTQEIITTVFPINDEFVVYIKEDKNESSTDSQLIWKN